MERDAQFAPGTQLVGCLAVDEGYLAGKLDPGGAVSGARGLQMIGSVSGLVASAQASMASLQEAGLAEAFAAATASQAAGDEDERPTPPPAASPTPPRAAEAATEWSEP